MVGEVGGQVRSVTSHIETTNNTSEQRQHTAFSIPGPMHWGGFSQNYLGHELYTVNPAHT